MWIKIFPKVELPNGDALIANPIAEAIKIFVTFDILIIFEINKYYLF